MHRAPIGCLSASTRQDLFVPASADVDKADLVLDVTKDLKSWKVERQDAGTRCPLRTDISPEVRRESILLRLLRAQGQRRRTVRTAVVCRASPCRRPIRRGSTRRARKSSSRSWPAGTTAAAWRSARRISLHLDRRCRIAEPARSAQHRPGLLRSACRASCASTSIVPTQARPTRSRRTIRSSAWPTCGRRSGRSASAIRGRCPSTARPATCGSATSAGNCGRWSTRSRRAATTAGRSRKARSRSSPTRKIGPTPILPPTRRVSAHRGGVDHRRLRLSRQEVPGPGRGVHLRRLDVAEILGHPRRRRQAGNIESEIAQGSPKVVSFGEDNDGELYILDYNEPGGIYVLEPNPDAAKPRKPFPTKLSETGLFADVAQQSLADGVYPYSINARAVGRSREGSAARRFAGNVVSARFIASDAAGAGHGVVQVARVLPEGRRAGQARSRWRWSAATRQQLASWKHRSCTSTAGDGTATHTGGTTRKPTPRWCRRSARTSR